MWWEMEFIGADVDVPSHDPLVGRPKGIAFQHFLDRYWLFARWWIEQCQWTERVINGSKSCAHDLLLLVMSMCQEKKIININVHSGHGRAAVVLERRRQHNLLKGCTGLGDDVPPSNGPS
jgi:hypothetical protein